MKRVSFNLTGNIYRDNRLFEEGFPICKLPSVLYNKVHLSYGVNLILLNHIGKEVMRYNRGGIVDMTKYRIITLYIGHHMLLGIIRKRYIDKYEISYKPMSIYKTIYPLVPYMGNRSNRFSDPKYLKPYNSELFNAIYNTIDEFI